MSKTAVFVIVKAKPGKREELRQTWEQYLKPHAEAEGQQEITFYCTAVQDDDTLCLFELFSESYNLQAAFESDWFKAYMEKVAPLLAAPPNMVIAAPFWVKGTTI